MGPQTFALVSFINQGEHGVLVEVPGTQMSVLPSDLRVDQRPGCCSIDAEFFQAPQVIVTVRSSMMCALSPLLKPSLMNEALVVFFSRNMPKTPVAKAVK
jgi:hypothetical protein